MIHGRGPSSTYAPLEIREASASFGEGGAPEVWPGAFQALIGLGAAGPFRRTRVLARRAAVAVNVALAAALAAGLAAAYLAIFQP